MGCSKWGFCAAQRVELRGRNGVSGLLKGLIWRCVCVGGSVLLQIGVGGTCAAHRADLGMGEGSLGCSKG